MWKLILSVFAAVIAVGSGMTMVGGFKDIDINDSGARDALEVAVDAHNRQSNDLFRSKWVDVVSVKSQVVAGIKYVITVKMMKTPCRKSSGIEECEIPQDLNTPTYQCEFTVLRRPWENVTTFLKQTC